MEDEALAPRIKNIFELYKSEILENISTLNDEDLRASLLLEEPEEFQTK